MTQSGLPGLKAEINRLNTFSEFLSFVHVTLHVTRLLPFTLSIPPPRATLRAVGTGFEVDPFTILKAPYPTGQPARLGEAGHTPRDEHLKTSTSRPSSATKPPSTLILSSTPKPLSNSSSPSSPIMRSLNFYYFSLRSGFYPDGQMSERQR